MRVVVLVAGRVLSVGYIESVGRVLFCAASCEVAFALLCYNVLYVSLFVLEVVVHRFGLVLGASFAEYRFAGQLAERVFAAYGVDGVVAEVHLYLCGIKLDVAVCHRA